MKAAKINGPHFDDSVQLLFRELGDSYKQTRSAFTRQGTRWSFDYPLLTETWLVRSSINSHFGISVAYACDIIKVPDTELLALHEDPGGMHQCG